MALITSDYINGPNHLGLRAGNACGVKDLVNYKSLYYPYPVRPRLRPGSPS